MPCVFTEQVTDDEKPVFIEKCNIKSEFIYHQVMILNTRRSDF